MMEVRVWTIERRHWHINMATDLGLTQILPMLDEETGAEPRAQTASIVDPYLLLVRDDSSIFVAQIDSSNELEEVEKTDQSLVTTKWLAGCLYTDSRGVFQPSHGDKGTETGDKIMMFLLSSTGALHVSRQHETLRETD